MMQNFRRVSLRESALSTRKSRSPTTMEPARCNARGPTRLPERYMCIRVGERAGLSAELHTRFRTCVVIVVVVMVGLRAPGVSGGIRQCDAKPYDSAGR